VPAVSADVYPRLPAHLQGLTDRARGYVEAASSQNTRKAYASDRTGSVLPPGAAAGACRPCRRIRRSSASTSPPVLVAVPLARPNVARRQTPSRRSNCSQRGMALDRKDRAIATVMAGIRNTHAAPPRQKEAILPEDLIARLRHWAGGPCAACATAPCCCLALLAVSGVRKLSGSTLAATRATILWVGSRCSTTACC